MLLRKMTHSLLLVLCLLLIIEPAAFAQQPSNYDARLHLQAVQGKHIIVSFADGTVEEGKLATLGTQSFTLEQGPQRGINSFDYAKVVQVQRPHSKRNMGLVIALIVAPAVAGTAIGLALYESHKVSVTTPPTPAFTW